MQRLAQVKVTREPFGTEIEVDVEDRAVAVPPKIPAELHRLVELLGAERGPGDGAVLEEVYDGTRVGGHVRHVDDVEPDRVTIPVLRVLLQAHVRPVHPPRHHERPVGHEILGVGGVPPVTAGVEVLADGIVEGKRDELVEEPDWTLELHLQDSVADRCDTKRFGGHLPGVDGLGILHEVEDEGVLGSVSWVHNLAPGKGEILRRYRTPVAPSRIVT